MPDSDAQESSDRAQSLGPPSDKIRDAGKWLLAAAAAIGAALIAGSQLSDIGGLAVCLPGPEWIWGLGCLRLPIAIIAAVIALASVAYMLWRAVGLLVPIGVTLGELREEWNKPKPRADIVFLRANPRLMPADSPNDVAAGLDNAEAASTRARDAVDKAQSHVSDADRTLALVREKLTADDLLSRVEAATRAHREAAEAHHKAPDSPAAAAQLAAAARALEEIEEVQERLVETHQAESELKKLTSDDALGQARSRVELVEGELTRGRLESETAARSGDDAAERVAAQVVARQERAVADAHRTLTELTERIDRLEHDRQTKQAAAVEGAETELATVERVRSLVAGDLKIAEDTAKEWRNEVSKLTDIAQYQLLLADFRGLTRSLVLGAAIAAAGITIFAWASNPEPAGANLTGAKLVGAYLQGANLASARLDGADLTNADLRGADLSGASLTGVIWKNTTCPDGTNSDAHNPSAPTCLGHLEP